MTAEQLAPALVANGSDYVQNRDGLIAAPRFFVGDWAFVPSLGVHLKIRDIFWSAPRGTYFVAFAEGVFLEHDVAPARPQGPRLVTEDDGHGFLPLHCLNDWSPA